MARERSLFDERDPAAEAEAEARRSRRYRSRLISRTAVRRWLASWGTGARLPSPQIGD